VVGASVFRRRVAESADVLRGRRPLCPGCAPRRLSRRIPITNHTIPTPRKPECKLAFHVERGPTFLLVAIKGEAGFDQAEFISAQLLRIPLEAYSLVVLNLAELTSLSSLAMGALVEYRRGLLRLGVEVRLANVQAQVRLALESAGLGKLFELIDLDEPTRPAASAGA
jgi:anti-anti-sigma factor